jgi:hypothetical protein
MAAPPWRVVARSRRFSPRLSPFDSPSPFDSRARNSPVRLSHGTRQPSRPTVRRARRREEPEPPLPGTATPHEGSRTGTAQIHAYVSRARDTLARIEQANCELERRTVEGESRIEHRASNDGECCAERRRDDKAATIDHNGRSPLASRSSIASSAGPASATLSTT